MTREHSLVEAGDGESPGALLRRYRLAAMLTQEELSALSGLSVRAISSMECGRTSKPYRRSVRMLADALALPDDERAILAGAVHGSPGPAGAVNDRQAAAAPTAIDGHAAPVEASPAQLPPDIGEFTGRAAQVSRLRDALAPGATAGAARIGAITGAGGLGKSALAIHVAHQLRDEFPDGQLFIELQGSIDQPVTSGDALARLLRHLGVSDAIMPKDDAELAAEYRTRMADRRLLVILDDARDAAQVRPLLPGTASCAVLITSRSWLPGLEGARLLALDRMEDTEALALFAAICGAERAAAEPAATGEVLAACGGLPLAVRIAATRLVSRPRWDIGSLAGRLAGEMQRLEELQAGDLAVRTSFQVSYATLPGTGGPPGRNAQRAFRLLGLWPGSDISLPAAAALLGLDLRSADRALEKLADIHLLEVPAPRRYRFHDLIRVFAAERAEQDEPPEARELAVQRLLSWYLHTAAGVRRTLRLVPSDPVRVLVPLQAGVLPLDFADHDTAAGWMAAERAHLGTAVALAARWRLHRLCGQLGTMAWHGNLRRPGTGWASVLETAIAGAATAGEPGTQAWLLNALSITLMFRGSSRAALARLEEALLLSHEAGDELCEAKVTAHLAIACRLLQRYDEAITHAERSLASTRILDPQHVGRSLSNLGLLYVEAGHLEEGARRLEQSLTVSNASGDRAYDSLAYAGLADACRQLGRLPEAIGLAQKAVQVSRQANDPYQEMDALRALGETLAETGDTERARACLMTAVSLARQLDIPESEGLAASIAALRPGQEPG